MATRAMINPNFIVHTPSSIKPRRKRRRQPGEIAWKLPTSLSITATNAKGRNAKTATIDKCSELAATTALGPICHRLVVGPSSVFPVKVGTEVFYVVQHCRSCIQIPVKGHTQNWNSPRRYCSFSISHTLSAWDIWTTHKTPLSVSATE